MSLRTDARARTARLQRLLVATATCSLLLGCVTQLDAPGVSPGGPHPGAPSQYADAFPSAAPDFQPPTRESSMVGLESIGDDGQLPLDSALSLLALAVPGIATSNTTSSPNATSRSGSIAIRTVAAHWQSLTPQQQAAVQDALAMPSDDEIIGAAGSGRAIAAIGAGAKFDAPYTRQLLEALRSAGKSIQTTIATRLGWDLPNDPNVTIDSCEPYLGCANALWQSPAGPSMIGDGAYAGCNVRITRLALNGGPEWILNTVAHEIFHCFQGYGYGSRERAGHAPAWVIEGGAEWVGNDVTGDHAPTDLLLADWLLSPGIELFRRKYDAAGFWGHLSETGIDPYTVFTDVFRKSDNSSAFAATGADTNAQMMNSWGSSVTLKEQFGRDWETVAPGMPDLPAIPESWDVGNGASVEIHAEPYTARVFQLSVDADILAISGTGRARIADGRIDTTAFPAKFCTNPSGCVVDQSVTCPGQPAVPPAPLASNPWFVVTGGVSGTTYTLSGEKWEGAEPCPTPTPPTPTPSDDKFCTLYRDYVAWAQSQGEGDVTKPRATEIATRFIAMHPYAPDELVDDVEVMIGVYATFAGVDDPYNVPAAGLAGAAKIPSALKAMNAYCGVSMPGL